MRKAAGPGLLGLCLLLCLVCLGIQGLLAPLEAVFHLVCGWVLFLVRVLPQVRLDPAGILVAVVCLVGLAVGLHLFLRWLSAHRPAAATQPPRWRPRWTALVLSLVVLMFTAGISAVGITHQATWLLTSRPPITRTRGDHERNLFQMSIVILNYEGDHGTLPPGGTFDEQGNGLHGWQTLLLPYVEHGHVYKKIDLEVPWHHPRNAEAMRTPVNTYLHADADQYQDEAGYALSHYASNVRVMGSKARTIKSITDGTANTILMGEAWTNYRPWGHPANWRDPARGIRTTPDSFGHPRHSDAVVFGMADGSVRSVSSKVSPEVLRALATPDGGEDVPPGDW